MHDWDATFRVRTVPELVDALHAAGFADVEVDVAELVLVAG